MHLTNNKKRTSGRKVFYTPKHTLLGTSIVPLFGTKAYTDHMVNKPAEKRVVYIEFVRSEKKEDIDSVTHFKNDVINHENKVKAVVKEMTEALYTKYPLLKGTVQYMSSNNIVYSSRKRLLSK